MRKVVHTFNKATGEHHYYGSLVAACKEENVSIHILNRLKGSYYEDDKYIVRIGRLVPAKHKKIQDAINKANTNGTEHQ